MQEARRTMEASGRHRLGNSERDAKPDFGELDGQFEHRELGPHLGNENSDDRGYNTWISTPAILASTTAVGACGAAVDGFVQRREAGSLRHGRRRKCSAPDQRNTVFVSDDLALVRGKHLFVFGGEYVDNQLNLNNAYEGNGNFTFNGQYSANGPLGGSAGGNGALDFIEGALSSLQQSKYQQNANRGPIPSIYVQDTYHAGKKLTLVAGVRWSPFFYPADLFWPYSPIRHQRISLPTRSFRLPKCPSRDHVPWGSREFQKQVAGKSPRPVECQLRRNLCFFGDGKTVIRGGLAQVYEQPNVFVGQRTQRNAPFFHCNQSGHDRDALLLQSVAYWRGLATAATRPVAPFWVPFPQAQVPTKGDGRCSPHKASGLCCQRSISLSKPLQYTFSVQHDFPPRLRFGQLHRQQEHTYAHRLADLPCGLRSRSMGRWRHRAALGSSPPVRPQSSRARPDPTAPPPATRCRVTRSPLRIQSATEPLSTLWEALAPTAAATNLSAAAAVRSRSPTQGTPTTTA